MTRTMQRDWPESCFGAETVMNLRQIFRASFWYKFLEHVSLALAICHVMCNDMN